MLGVYLHKIRAMLCVPRTCMSVAYEHISKRHLLIEYRYTGTSHTKHCPDFVEVEVCINEAKILWQC